MSILAKVLAAILKFLALALGFLVSLVVWAAVKIFLLFSTAVLAVLSAIPVPEFLENFGLNLSAIPAGVKFFLAPLDFGTGLSWVVSAYILRFLIRRLPFVG